MMRKNILIVSASLRVGSNSELLAAEFAKGAQDAGHRVEIISLRDKTLNFCTGCLSCQSSCTCIFKDDASLIAEKMLGADVLAFATPIYFYEMAGQMKTMLDRSNPLYPAEYAFRDVYLLATASEEEDAAMDGAVKGLQGWIECFEKAFLAGVVRGTGVAEANAVKSFPEILKKAYHMGHAIKGEC